MLPGLPNTITDISPSIMGIINCSTNSFYGAVTSVDEAIQKADEMVRSGVDILDIGGEATNPSVNIELDQPNPQQECDRVLPVIEAVAQRFEVRLSVDTSCAEVMKAAIDRGVTLINDQRALQRPDSMSVIAKAPSDVQVCLMHFFQRRQPGSDSHESMLQTIISDLRSIIHQCHDHGIAHQRLIVDPGFGQGHYGKNTVENYYLLSQLPRLKVELDNLPLLVGWSRKSMIGDVVDRPVDFRLPGSVAAATLATYLGADILRVHDVEATRQALAVTCALKQVLQQPEAVPRIKEL